MIKISNKEHQEKLNELLQPVFNYMQENLHPHCTLIISATEGELVEGVCGLKANKIID